MSRPRWAPEAVSIRAIICQHQTLSVVTRERSRHCFHHGQEKKTRRGRLAPIRGNPDPPPKEWKGGDPAAHLTWEGPLGHPERLAHSQSIAGRNCPTGGLRGSGIEGSRPPT